MAILQTSRLCGRSYKTVVKKKPADKAKRAQAALVRRMGIDPEHGWVANYQVLRNGTHDSLKALQASARARGNVFESLLEASKYFSLGQMSHALYEVGGEYRRNM